jgi:hypothetical protein
MFQGQRGVNIRLQNRPNPQTLSKRPGNLVEIAATMPISEAS